MKNEWSRMDLMKEVKRTKIFTFENDFKALWLKFDPDFNPSVSSIVL